MSVFDTIVFESKDFPYYKDSYIHYDLENRDFYDEEDEQYSQDEIFEVIEDHYGAICIASFTWRDHQQVVRNKKVTLEKIAALTDEYASSHSERFKLYLKTTRYWRKGIDVDINEYEENPFEIDIENTITMYLLVVPR